VFLVKTGLWSLKQTKIYVALLLNSWIVVRRNQWSMKNLSNMKLVCCCLK
jgi:hypothetical protein